MNLLYKVRVLPALSAVAPLRVMVQLRTDRNPALTKTINVLPVLVATSGRRLLAVTVHVFSFSISAEGLNVPPRDAKPLGRFGRSMVKVVSHQSAVVSTIAPKAFGLVTCNPRIARTKPLRPPPRSSTSRKEGREL